MTRTENLNLPQWEAHDPIRRGDFNEAMAKLDSMVAIGSYTGNGGTQSIELGFKPRFVIVTGQEMTGGVGATALLGYIAFTGGPQIQTSVLFTDNGFTVTYVSMNSFPVTNYNGKIYSYVAFR